MTTYSPSTPKAAVSRPNFLHAAAVFSSAILAIGYAGPVSAQASSEDTMARCQQLYSLFTRHNSDGYARPLEARMGLEDCQKGNISTGIAALKRALDRSRIAIPPAESATAQPPAPTPAPAPTLKPSGERRRQSQ
jgi:hypothetical protein